MLRPCAEHPRLRFSRTRSRHIRTKKMIPFDWKFPYHSQRMPVLARNVVATSQPLAAQAGLSMLMKVHGLIVIIDFTRLSAEFEVCVGTSRRGSSIVSARHASADDCSVRVFLPKFFDMFWRASKENSNDLSVRVFLLE